MPGATLFGSRSVDFSYDANSGTPRVGAIRVSFGGGFYTDVGALQAARIGCGEVKSDTFHALPWDPGTPQGLYPYEFSANAGDAIKINPAVGFVYDPAGNYVDLSSYAGEASGPLPLTGTYTISLTYSQITGNYGLGLQFTQGGSCSSSITCGQTASGTISDPLKMNAYRFSANAGEAVILRSVPTGTTSGSFSPNALLYRPDGRLTSRDQNQSLPLPQTGTYTIIVLDYSGSAIGTYDLGLQFTTGRCAKTIACGQVFAATPIKRNQMDTYKFSGNAGQQAGLFLNSSVGTGSTNGALFDPNGQFVVGDVPGINGTAFGGGAQTWTLPKTGDYTYLVSPGDPSVLGLPSSGIYDLYRPCPGVCTASLMYNHTVGGMGNESLPAIGGDALGVYLLGTVAVLIGPGCPWTSASNANWLRIISGGSKDKLWFLTFQADPNLAAGPRTGTLTQSLHSTKSRKTTIYRDYDPGDKLRRR